MRRAHLLVLILTTPFLLGCERADVVIYSALDQVHSEPLIKKFERDTGLTVRARYDQEAVKTVGLVNALVSEADNPKCDVFWNNELVHTIRLKNKGLLAPYVSPSAEGIPDKWKDEEGYWTGFAARARVLILNTDVAKKVEPDVAKWPTSTMDLLDPKWKGKIVSDDPLKPGPGNGTFLFFYQHPDYSLSNSQESIAFDRYRVKKRWQPRDIYYDNCFYPIPSTYLLYRRFYHLSFSGALRLD